MFISDSHQPTRLTPRHYLDRNVTEREVERGFMPGWHLVGVSGEFPVDGDFRTISILGRDIILWRRGDRFVCFLNVCSHRFCALTAAVKGRFRERLRCQYHGWEYDESGQTRKIPDAPAFKPLQQGRLGLVEYPVATVGDLVFVSFHPAPEPIESFLGEAHSICAERCGGDWEHVWSWEPTCDGNWKLAMEITLEGYHTVAAHEGTLGRFPLPREEAMTHLFQDDSHTGLTVGFSDRDHPQISRTSRLIRRLGRTPEYVYHHQHAFPHFGVIASDAYAIAQAIYPVGPDRHVNLYRMFVYRGRRPSWRGRLLYPGHAAGLRGFWEKVFAEDRAVTSEHHRGMSSSVLPDGGLMSRREERIIHFQAYVLGISSDAVEPAGSKRKV
jgi:choline monooxygenase